MKRSVFYLLFISCVVLFSSCNNNEITLLETINGTWHMKNVQGGLSGIDLDYNPEEVKWTFNLQNNILEVENNITTNGPHSIYAGLESGTYNFEIQQNWQEQTLYVNNNKQGVLILIGNNLKIDDDIAADGFITEFEK